MGKPDWIFLSYARENAKIVEDIYEQCQKADFNPWMDTKNIVPGREWEDEIKNALKNSSVVVVFLSKHSVANNKTWCHFEAHLASEQSRSTHPESKLPVVPVLLDSCEIPPSLQRFQFYDYYKGEGTEGLLKAVQSNRANRHSHWKDLLPHTSEEGSCLVTEPLPERELIGPLAKLYFLKEETAREVVAETIKLMSPGFGWSPPDKIVFCESQASGNAMIECNIGAFLRSVRENSGIDLGVDFFGEETLLAILRIGLLHAPTQNSARKEFELLAERAGASSHPAPEIVTRAMETAIYRIYLPIYRGLGRFAEKFSMDSWHWIFSSDQAPHWWWTGIWHRVVPKFREALDAALRYPADYVPASFARKKKESELFQEEEFLSDAENKPIFRFVRISADPGMGKTSLVASLAAKALDNLLQLKSLVIPLPVLFHDFDWKPEKGMAQDSEVLMDFFKSILFRLFRGMWPIAEYEKFIVNWLDSPDRPVMVLADGFDLVEKDFAKKIVADFLSFSSPMSPLNGDNIMYRVIITGRPWSWEAGGIDEQLDNRRYIEFKGKGFDDEKTLRSYFGADSSEDAEWLEQITEEEKDNLRIPMIANAVKSIFENAPGSRIEFSNLAKIYKKLVEKIFGEHLSREKDISVDEAIEGWCRLSLFGMWRDPGQVRQHIDWKRDIELRAMIAKWSENGHEWARSWVDATNKIPAIRPPLLSSGLERSGENKDSDRFFYYCHQTFKDYFAALALCKLEDIETEAPDISLGINERIDIGDRIGRLVQCCQNDDTDGRLQLTDLRQWKQCMIFLGGMIEDEQIGDSVVENLVRKGEPWIAGHMVYRGKMPIGSRWKNALPYLLKFGGGDVSPGFWYDYRVSGEDDCFGLIDISELAKRPIPTRLAEYLSEALSNLEKRYDRQDVRHDMAAYDGLSVSILDILHFQGRDVSFSHRKDILKRLSDYTYVHSLSDADQRAIYGAACGYCLPSERNANHPWKDGKHILDYANVYFYIVSKRLKNGFVAAVSEGWRATATVVEKAKMGFALRHIAVAMARSARWNERRAALDALIEIVDQLKGDKSCEFDDEARFNLLELEAQLSYTDHYGWASIQRYMQGDLKLKLTQKEISNVLAEFWEKFVELVRGYESFYSKRAIGFFWGAGYPLAWKAMGEIIYNSILLDAGWSPPPEPSFSSMPKGDRESMGYCYGKVVEMDERVCRKINHIGLRRRLVKDLVSRTWASGIEKKEADPDQLSGIDRAIDIILEEKFQEFDFMLSAVCFANRGIIRFFVGNEKGFREDIDTARKLLGKHLLYVNPHDLDAKEKLKTVEALNSSDDIRTILLVISDLGERA